MRHTYLVACVTCLWIAGASAADNGDPHSFGRPVKWRGGFLDNTGIVLRNDCSTAPPAQRCVQLQPAPAVTQFEERDLETMVLAANSASARSLLCQVVTPYLVYTMSNPNAQSASGAFAHAAATLRVESPVLADPTLINPFTQQPFGGFFEEALPAAHSLHKTLAALQSETVSDIDRSRFCVAGNVSKRRLIDVYGLSAAQATTFFASEIILRLGMRGSTRLVNDGAQFQFHVRFLSD